MENKRRWVKLITLCLISLIVGSAARGVPAPLPTEPLSTQPLPPPLQTNPRGYVCEDVKAIDGEIQMASNGIFVDGQLLLRGPEGILNLVVTERDLTPLRVCRLNYISPSLVMGWYNVPEGVDPQQLSNQINEKYIEAGGSASPNYLVGSSAGSCADPYSDGGSPLGTLNTDAAEQMLFTQWALKKIGLTHIKTWTSWNNVHVAIFDTVPKQFQTVRPGIDVNRAPQIIKWPNDPDPTFQLKVHDVIGNLRFDPMSAEPRSVPLNLSSHGLFVAGLIRLIAPNSPTHLIRVLGDNACGSVGTLVEGIDGFMSAMKAGGIRKVVINLSLGVHHLPHGDVPLLRATLRAANQSGALIVAAAGNDSPELAPPIRAQVPARYPFVVGVVASTPEGRRSCYSNRAISISNHRDLAAPGGNGGKNPSDGTEDCVSRTMTWAAPPQPCTGNMRACGYGLVSLIEPVNIGPNQWDPQYGYWSGTSFATPLVSGLAALIFQSPSATNTWVYCVIEQGARPLPGTPTPPPNLGAGVISVQRSLSLAAAGACP
jgi:subtilisin family serine protease